MKRSKIHPNPVIGIVVAACIVVLTGGCAAVGEIEEQPATIAGSVDGYRGVSAVIVIVYDNAELQENSQMLRWETASDSHDFARYIGYGTWWLVAFVDTNEDGEYSPGEPYGEYDYNPIELTQDNVIETDVIIDIDSN